MNEKHPEQMMALLAQMETDYDSLLKTRWQSQEIRDVAMTAKRFIGTYIVALKDILLWYRENESNDQAKRLTLLEALHRLSIDMHEYSMRPCETCRGITEIIHQPFGCYHYQACCKRNN